MTDYRRLELQEAPTPEPDRGESLIRVRFAGICGSDLSGFLGHSARRKPPLILGHELVGTVEAHGPGVSSPAIGTTVVVNPLFACGTCDACRKGAPNVCVNWRLLGMDDVQGAMAEYVTVPVASLQPASNPSTAIPTEPLAVGVHALRLSHNSSFASTLIIGAGTQGALLTRLATLAGYKPIIVSDPNARRLAVASELGATHTFDPRSGDLSAYVRDLMPNGVDTVLETVGSSATRNQALAACRKGGEVIMVGLADAKADIDYLTLVRNEQRLQGAFAYTPHDFQTAGRLLQSGRVNVEKWTETLPLEQGQEAFECLSTDPGATLKMVLQP